MCENDACNKKSGFKRIIIRRTMTSFILFSLYMCVGLYATTIIPSFCDPYNSKNIGFSYAAESAQKPVYMLGDNYCENTYGVYGETIKSYLLPLSDGYMRVQGGYSGLTDDVVDTFGIEYFDSQFQRVSSMTIPLDLPIWGGFCAYRGYYYVVTGQKNKKELDDLNVIMVTKYDTDWNRIASVGVSDIGVTIPFDAGSCSIACYKNRMVIRMGKEGYRSDDGLRHQSSKTILIDTENMTVMAKLIGGSVSHSFNQIIRFNGNRLLAVDHGDANPRAIVFFRYGKRDDDDISRLVKNKIELLKIKGENGDNYTGALLGDLQCSSEAYLITGSSIDQDPNSKSEASNIYLGVVNYKTLEPELRWITQYSEKEPFVAGNSYLVKVNSNKILLMWNEIMDKDSQTRLKYIYLDANGYFLSDVYESKAILTDCHPVINGDSIIWYAWKDGKITFYQISIENPENMKKKVIWQRLPQKVLAEGLKKTVSYSRLKKDRQKFKAVRVFEWEGKVTYSGTGLNAKSKKALKINKNTGRVTVKMNTKKGTYKMRVKVKAAGNKKYLPGSDSVTVKICVK